MNKSILLEIRNLTVKIGNKGILSNFDLCLYRKNVHVLMGPNGAGKSTLARVLVRDKKFIVKQGSLFYNGIDLLQHTTEWCSLNGIFLSFQHPVELSGVLNLHFLRTIYNTHLSYLGKEQLSTVEFIPLVKSHMHDLNIEEEFLYRYVNVGFSGGERKKNEILQISLLSPKLVILDEIDSGLDVDALKKISFKLNALKDMNATSFLIITHYPRILNYITPDFVHVLNNGKIIKTGNYELSLEIEREGYSI